MFQQGDGLFWWKGGKKAVMGYYGMMDILSANLLDKRHMRAFIVGAEVLRCSTGLAVGEDEDRVSHRGGLGWKCC